MKIITLILISLLFLYFLFDAYKQLKKDKKLIVKNIKVPLIGIFLALLLFDTIMKR